ncbi:MAG: hypothetical protein QG576_637 [Bacteroidota bacterium]|nr:hypothetical protein [Bacteroidota bacterium]
MKKLLLSLLIIVCTVSTSDAQFTKVGGGAVFTSGYHYNNETTGTFADVHRSPLLGMFVTGIYELNLPFHLSPSFTFFFPRHNSNGFEETRTSTMMFDVNGHYVFNSLDKFEFYGLAGIDIAFAHIKWLDVVGSTGSDNAIGLNLGVGTYMKLTDQFDLYGEAKYILSKYDQFVFNVGVLINIDWLIKHENTDL